MSETVVQRLTEENRLLTEDCETSRTRIATLMEVSKPLRCCVNAAVANRHFLYSPFVVRRCDWLHLRKTPGVPR